MFSSREAYQAVVGALVLLGSALGRTLEPQTLPPTRKPSRAVAEPFAARLFLEGKRPGGREGQAGKYGRQVEYA